MDIKSLKEYLIKKGYKTRACRFKVISDLVGISEEEAKASEKINRYIRELLPKDEVGAKKEKEWQRGEALHTWEWENKTRQNNLDIRF